MFYLTTTIAMGMHENILFRRMNAKTIVKAHIKPF